MNQERIKKLERTSKELVSKFIFEEMWESEIDFWLITVTWVKISSDLSYLDIYISCFKNNEILAKTLAKHAYIIQKKLNKSILIRKLPKIRFRYDEDWEISQKICQAIEKEINN